MKLTRREFLASSAGGAGLALLPGWPRTCSSEDARESGVPTLVVLFLRGGADGVGLVPPWNDDDYHRWRPRLALRKPDLIDLDGFYGLHPALAELLPLYRAGELAIVHAVGSHAETRSHFEAQAILERAGASGYGVEVGWLNRLLSALGGSDPCSGITLGEATVEALAGPSPTLSIRSIDRYHINGPPGRIDTLRRLYQTHDVEVLGEAMQATLSAVDRIAALRGGGSRDYPQTALARSLRDAATLIRSRIGVRIIAVASEGWDHHSAQAWRLQVCAQQLADALAAFRSDLKDEFSRTCTLVVTEFGRSLPESGGEGTEHGHGSIMLLLGGAVEGGRVWTRDGEWPGLGADQLYQGRDLAITTDYREVFAAVATRHMGLEDAESVVPGFGRTADRVGLFRPCA